MTSIIAKAIAKPSVIEPCDSVTIAVPDKTLSDSQRRESTLSTGGTKRFQLLSPRPGQAKVPKAADLGV